jgi:hypothetical protein
MIDDILNYIRAELIEDLGLDNGDVHMGHIYHLKENNTDGLYLSLVNLEEEITLRNTSHVLKQNNGIRYQEPPVFLNLYLLFSFRFSSYETSMLRLSQTVELFQNKRVFEASNATDANPFPSALEKLIFDFTNLNIEQLNHLWGVLGGAYLPSVLYKVRMVKIQRDESLAGPAITTIQVETSVS